MNLLGSLLGGAWGATKFGVTKVLPFAARTGIGVTGAVFSKETLNTGLGLAHGAWNLGRFAHKYQLPIGIGIAAGAYAYGAMSYPAPNPRQYAEVRGRSPMNRFKSSAQGDIVFGLHKMPGSGITPSEAIMALA